MRIKREIRRQSRPNNKTSRQAPDQRRQVEVEIFCFWSLNFPQ